MADLADAALLARFLAGDGQALDAILERYETPLFQMLVGILRDTHLAEDALQETFVRALERLDGVDPEHLRGWLFTVAYHQAMLLRRRRQARPAVALRREAAVPDPAPGPARRAEDRDEVRHLHTLLDKLPASQREVIRQRVYEGKRFREIAADLDCPLNTALARMHDGIKRLRLLMENDHA